MYRLQCFCITFLLESDVFLALILRINFRSVNTSAFLLLVHLNTSCCCSFITVCIRVIYVSSAATTIWPGKCYPCWTLRTDFCTCNCLNSKPRWSSLFKLVQLEMAAIIVVVVAVYIMKMTSHYIDVTFWRAVK